MHAFDRQDRDPLGQQALPSRLARRTWLAAAAGALVTLATGTAAAQAFPSKPISLMVPYPAGGLSDVIARMVEKPLAKAGGEMVIVDNLGGTWIETADPYSDQLQPFTYCGPGHTYDPAFPERFAPPAVMEKVKQRKKKIVLETDDIPEESAYTSPELSADASRGLPE